jgi:hypothetical protein
MATKTANKKLTDALKLQIRNEYVQGIDDESGERVLFTLDELYKKHKVAKSTLYRAANKESWKVERERFQQQYLSKLDQERAKNLSVESKKFDTNSLNLAKALMATVGQNIRKNTENINEGKKNFIPSQINALANAALSAQRLAKLALGETTHNVELNANITEEAAFREAMELLDTVARNKQQANDSSVH